MRAPPAVDIGSVRVDPCVVLAPMEGVTDLAFRRLIRRLGGVGLTCTEFVASQGLSVGKSKRLWEMASFDPDERPVTVQLYGRDPYHMAEAARLVADRGASIIDINMGCPSKKVCANSGGSALMGDVPLAMRIVRAVRAAVKTPVTVKMRAGLDAAHRNAPDVAWGCQEEGADAVTVHWRTREDRYQGERSVDMITATVERLSIPVLGNGDIIDVASAQAMFRETGCAGVMVGRGAIRTPWLPRQIAQWLQGETVTEPTLETKHQVLVAYFDAIEATFRTPKRALGRMKMMARYFAETLPQGADFRQQILRAQSGEEARTIVEAYFQAPRAPDPANYSTC